MELTNIVPSAIYRYHYEFGRYWEEPMKFPDGPDDRFGGETDDIYKLNWLSIEDIVENEHVLSDSQSVGLKFILNPNFHADKNTNKYITNTILQTMADSPHFVSYCHCGTINNSELTKKKEKEEGKKAVKHCNRWKFCDRCCKPLRYGLLKRIEDYYSETTKEKLWFITITDDDNRFQFSDTNYESIFKAWRKQQVYLDILANNGYITGAFKVEELSITSLYPTTQVNPHTHVICRSELPLGDHKVHGLKIKASQITSKDEWITKLNYLRKPIDVAKTYIYEWTSDKSTVINRNVKNFLHGYGVVFRDHKSFVRSGIFHGNNENSVLHTETEYFSKRPDQEKNFKKKTKATKERAKIRAKKDPMHDKKVRAAERAKAKSKTLKEKAPKKACKKTKKKIECKEPAMYQEFEKGVLDTLKVATLPEETVSLLKEAYEAYGVPGQEFAPPVEEQKPKSSFMGTLGKGLALGGLAAGGAYLYGKHGNGGANPLSNFAKTVDTGLAGAYEKGSPYLAKAIDKAPLLSPDFRNQAKSYLAPSAEDYASGIRNYAVDYGNAGREYLASKMDRSLLKGTDLNSTPSNYFRDGLQGAENVAGGVFMGNLAKQTPAILRGTVNAAGKVMPFARPATTAVAGSIDRASGTLSKIPGVGTIGKGLGKALGPAAAVFGMGDAIDMGERIAVMNAQEGGINKYLPPISGVNAVHRLLGSVQRNQSLPEFVRNGADGTNRMLGRVAGGTTHALSPFIPGTFGLGALALPMANQATTGYIQKTLDRTAASSMGNALTKAFNEAVAMKDKGYNNPLQGWYSSMSPEGLQNYVKSLSDRELAAKIEAMNPNR